MVKRSLLGSFLLFFLVTLSGQITGYRINWDCQNQTFNEFVKSAEMAYGVRFFFEEDWINNIRLQKMGEQATIGGVLENVLRGKDIFFNTDKRGNIILTKSFRIKSLVQEEKKETNYIPQSENKQSDSQVILSENIISEIGNPAEKAKKGNAIVTGYVRKKGSGEPLIGAAIYIQELSKGTVTNEFGFYTLNLPKGSYSIRFTLLGMKEVIFKTRIYGSGKFDVELTETLIPLKETIVTAEKNNVLERFEVGLEKLNMRTIRLMPTSLGETDILKSMLLLPGVKTVGEGSSGFNVRGGAADQNLILLYGVPVFNASHFFGFFSAINSDLIRDVLLYKGGIPAQYGGRISSVIDIISRDGNKEKLRGSAGISPITSHLIVEMPLIKNKMSLILTARTTYSNWVLGLIKNQALRNSKASFYDLSARIVYDINNNNRLELGSYFSHDSFKFNTDTTYNYGNQILSLRWRHTFNNNFMMHFSGSSSLYNHSVSSNRYTENAFILKHELDYSSVKTDFNLYSINNHSFSFGGEMIRYNILPGATYPFSDSSLVIPRILENEYAYEYALYAEDKINLSSRLSVNVGLRISAFSAIGPKMIKIYYPDSPISPATVTDTLMIGTGKIYKTYGGPEYRLSMNLLLTPKSSLKINYNRTRQYLHLLSNTTSISPTDTWKLSDYYLQPQVGDQFSAGYYITFPRKGIEISSEVYYKSVRNMIDFKGGATLSMNESLEGEIINVKGKAYGLEIMVKKNIGKMSLNIGYTYSRSMLQSKTRFHSESINSGNWFPASYDKPNDLIIAFNYIFTRRFSFSFNYIYNTGRPVTYPVTVYRNSNSWIVEYSDRNKYRLPYYSRLDLSARLNGNLRSGKLMNPYWTFSLYNALGRDNVYSVYFKRSGNTVKGYQLSVFATAIPTLTYSFDF